MNRLGGGLGALALSGGLLVVAERGAAGQDIEVPILVMEESGGGEAAEMDDDLDLANLVMIASAAKGVTTVQEAPAIITILPGDEIRDRQPRFLNDLIDLVPGFYRSVQINGQFPYVSTRGVFQSMLHLRDGVSMFDTYANAPTISRGVPLELIKRIEVISGPGGVLWGANSFLGVINMITKDAEDIDGIEASAGYGGGSGDPSNYRGYVMAGVPGLFGREDWSLVAHVAYEAWSAPEGSRPHALYITPPPQPNATWTFGPEQMADVPMSYLLDLNGKLVLGNLKIHWSAPIGQKYKPFGFQAAVAVDTLIEDSLVDDTGALLCTPVSRDDDALADGSDRCLDRNRAARRNVLNWIDRYVAAEYGLRFSADAGLSTKLYFVQLDKDFDLLIMNPSGLLEGGLALSAANEVLRVGSSVDGNVDITAKWRVLYGGEAFHEWTPDYTVRSRQGAGIESNFSGPYNLDRLPLPCPIGGGTWNAMNQTIVGAEKLTGCPLTMNFNISRTTIGAFVASQLRLTEDLVIDGGMRLQGAPELDSTALGYSPAATFSGGAVYEFIPDWHVKLNYAEGFRPPIFNNVGSNGEAVQLDGDRDLEVETSQSFQFEINARLLRGRERIRELDVRADYSYTKLTNFITFPSARYQNTGDRGVHSGEFLGKLYLKGGHRLELGWTWAQQVTDDVGGYRAHPEHWFNLSAINQLGGGLELATVVRVYGAHEDQNRRIETRGLSFDADGHAVSHFEPASSMNLVAGSIDVKASEVVVDRLPSSAELQVGVRYTLLDEQLVLQATAYNAMNATHYTAESFNAYQPRVEFEPSIFETFRFFASATYTF